MSNNYPANVKLDLNSGFRITDEDDGFQRCKKVSDTVYQYRCDYDGETFDEIIDTNAIDKEEAITGFYGSVEAVNEEFGEDANMIFAECEFEHNVAIR